MAFGLPTRTLLTAVCTDPVTGVFNRAGWELATTGHAVHAQAGSHLSAGQRAGPRPHPPADETHSR
ncbi:hypothetical protein GDN83_14440 [Gordonia jinghuaiqii]|nr:hypothetical protein [Gordonia jinghuaiqii]